MAISMYSTGDGGPRSYATAPSISDNIGLNCVYNGYGSTSDGETYQVTFGNQTAYNCLIIAVHFSVIGPF